VASQIQSRAHLAAGFSWGNPWRREAIRRGGRDEEEGGEVGDRRKSFRNSNVCQKAVGARPGTVLNIWRNTESRRSGTFVLWWLQ
jgi:hypothetical protein